MNIENTMFVPNSSFSFRIYNIIIKFNRYEDMQPRGFIAVTQLLQQYIENKNRVANSCLTACLCWPKDS